MRQAPPIALTLSCAGAWRVAQVVLPVLCAVVVGVWLASWLSIPAAPLLVAGTAVAIAAMVWFRNAPASVHLQWTGEHWAANGTAGEVDLMLDLGTWMLLRFRQPSVSPRWLPVPRREAGASEQGLRAALYARNAAAMQRQA